MSWLDALPYDPVTPLIESGNTPVVYFTRRDLLGEAVEPADSVWRLPEVSRITKKQTEDGSWIVKKAHEHTVQNYTLIETWKNLRFLVGMYGMDRKCNTIRDAARYIFSCQTKEGDIRGILGNQLTMYYTGAILSLLVEAGYADDPRTENGIAWLLSARQDDGGWIATPAMTLDDMSYKEKNDLCTKNRKTVTDWDRTRPFCINATGMAVRALAAHPSHRKTEYAKKAARLLKGCFFKKNNYTSYEHEDHWLTFRFPYWWNDLVSALDSITAILPDKNDPDIRKAFEWLFRNQEKSGLWKTSYSRIHKNTETQKTERERLWITLAICRIVKRVYG